MDLQEITWKRSYITPFTQFASNGNTLHNSSTISHKNDIDIIYQYSNVTSFMYNYQQALVL